MFPVDIKFSFIPFIGNVSRAGAVLTLLYYMCFNKKFIFCLFSYYLFYVVAPVVIIFTREASLMSQQDGMVREEDI